MVHININQYIPKIKSILRESDPQVITPKDVRLQLEDVYKVDLTPQKKQVQQLIEKLFDEMSSEEEEKEESDEFTTHSPASTSNRHLDEKKRKQKTSQSRKQADTKGRSRKTDVADVKKKSDLQKKKKTIKRKRKDEDDASEGEVKKKRITGIHKPLRLSPVMAEFLGETELSRLEVVKRLWNYIKTNDLQDPNDKRYIICDEKLYTIFGMDRLHSFTMNKYLTPHLNGIENTSGAHKRPPPQPALDGNDFVQSNEIKAEQPDEDKDGSEKLFDSDDEDRKEDFSQNLTSETPADGQ